MNNSIHHYGNGGVSFVGKVAVSVFQAIVIAGGLDLYAKTGMKPNRAYTPSAMLRAASVITGKQYKRGQYTQAASDLREWAQKQRETVPETKET